MSRLGRAQAAEAQRRGNAAAATRARVLEQAERRELIASSPALQGGAKALELMTAHALAVEGDLSAAKAQLAEALDIAARAEVAATVASEKLATSEAELAKLRSKTKSKAGGEA